IVGYHSSPMLEDKIMRGLSAGRVQSVAVRLVCEREAAIRAFVPEEYWTLEALLLSGQPPPFKTKLFRLDGQKVEIKDQATAEGLVKELQGATYTVTKVDKRERRRNAPAPFITSKLQQEAANRLGFTAKKTMTLSQKLYEGVELGDEGQVALITYMRTDSVRLSADAIGASREYVAARLGKDYLPPDPFLV